MLIKTAKLVDSTWIIEKIDRKNIKIYYKKIRKHGGKSPKPFIFPREIIINEFFSECAGLYLGDGKLTPNDLAHAQFQNRDLDLCYKILKWFNYLGAKNSDMTFIILFNDGDEVQIEENVRQRLELLKENITKKHSKRHRHVVFSVQTNGRIFRILLERIIRNSLNYIKRDTTLRKAWLRGYFAAEGCVAYNSKENYLASVTLAYNPNSESWLRDFCLNCLKKEGIYDKIKIRHEEHNGSIIITNWKNYYRMWKIGVFNGCERKRKIFEYAMTRVKVCCNLDTDFRRELFSSISQHELARILKTYQGTISNMINGTERNMWPTVKQIKTLCKMKKISFNRLKASIKEVRFGPLTTMKATDELIDDIFSFKEESLSS